VNEVKATKASNRWEKDMNIESFAKTKIGRLLVRAMGSAMESRFRYRFFSPTRILESAEILPAQTVLEVGCGTGYFTLPAARIIGENGYLVAMDILTESVKVVSRKVQEASLKNARVLKGDALNMGLYSGCFHVVLLLGVVPAPMLPLSRLLPELHRVLKPDGVLAVWPPVPGWLPQSIIKSGLFIFVSKRNGVSIFRRCQVK
jgi:ubiquinone/menaquinone biosynthesis C-methylase UbiE